MNKWTKKHNKPREVKPRDEAEKLGFHDAVGDPFPCPSRRRRRRRRMIMIIAATIIAKTKIAPKVPPNTSERDRMSDA